MKPPLKAERVGPLKTPSPPPRANNSSRIRHRASQTAGVRGGESSVKPATDNSDAEQFTKIKALNEGSFVLPSSSPYTSKFISPPTASPQSLGVPLKLNETNKLKVTLKNAPVPVVHPLVSSECDCVVPSPNDILAQLRFRCKGMDQSSDSGEYDFTRDIDILVHERGFCIKCEQWAHNMFALAGKSQQMELEMCVLRGELEVFQLNLDKSTEEVVLPCSEDIDTSNTDASSTDDDDQGLNGTWSELSYGVESVDEGMVIGYDVDGRPIHDHGILMVEDNVERKVCAVVQASKRVDFKIPSLLMNNDRKVDENKDNTNTIHIPTTSTTNRPSTSDGIRHSTLNMADIYNEIKPIDEHVPALTVVPVNRQNPILQTLLSQYFAYITNTNTTISLQEYVERGQNENTSDMDGTMVGIGSPNEATLASTLTNTFGNVAVQKQLEQEMQQLPNILNLEESMTFASKFLELTRLTSQRQRQEEQNTSIDNKKLHPDNFLTCKVLGRGSGGVVVQSIDISTQQYIAVKKVITKDQDQINQITREINHLHEIRSDYVIGIHGAYIESEEVADGREEESVCVVQEYMNEGSLESLLEMLQTADVVLPEEALAFILERSLRGLQALHRRGQVHRDIKPGNLLLNSYGEVKIADLGQCSRGVMEKGLKPTVRASPEEIEEALEREYGEYSEDEFSDYDHLVQIENRNRLLGHLGTSALPPDVKSDAQCDTFLGTVTYQSVERVLGSAYGFSADIYSLGLTLQTLLLREHPFGTSWLQTVMTLCPQASTKEDGSILWGDSVMNVMDLPQVKQAIAAQYRIIDTSHVRWDKDLDSTGVQYTLSIGEVVKKTAKGTSMRLLSSSFLDILHRMLETVPSDRLLAKQQLQQPYFTRVRYMSGNLHCPRLKGSAPCCTVCIGCTVAKHCLSLPKNGHKIHQQELRICHCHNPQQAYMLSGKDICTYVETGRIPNTKAYTVSKSSLDEIVQEKLRSLTLIMNALYTQCKQNGTDRLLWGDLEASMKHSGSKLLSKATSSQPAFARQGTVRQGKVTIPANLAAAQSTFQQLPETTVQAHIVKIVQKLQ